MTGRTIWHRRPEPEWCVVVHQDTDSPTNRECSSQPVDGPLTGSVALSMSRGHEASGGRPAHLATLDVELEMDYREVSPHIVLSTETQVTEVTLDEAEQLVAVLQRRIAEGRATERGKDQ